MTRHRQRAGGPSDGGRRLACNRNLPLTLRLEREASVRPIGGLLGPGTVPFDQSAGRDRAPLWHGDERVTCSGYALCTERFRRSRISILVP
jgi:hypothetical protein